MSERSPLDDPRNAAHAWRRFRRLMRLMVAITIVTVIVALVLIYRENGLESVHLLIATALGIGFMMLLTGALMGLVFLSNGTGHDDSVSPGARPDDAQPQDGRNR
jgi:RsiW-degrading membrane proteinase PrsW (M82 family)